MTYSAEVHDDANATTPTGTVRFTADFYGNPTTLCTATLSSIADGASSGSCAASNAPAGRYILAASYSGDDTIPPIDPGDAVIQTVYPPPAVTTTAVTANPPASLEGDQVKYTATVRPAPDTASPTGTGTVTFTMGSTRLCNNPIPLDATGQAECKSPKAPLGSGTVTATYSGDPGFTRSNGTIVGGFTGSTGTTTETVSARAAALATTTSVTADPPTSMQGKQVTYTATARPPAGKTTPTRTVSFTAGPKATPLCTAAIPLNGVGNAKCVSPRAPVGTDTVTATYQPADGSFTGSTGTTTETVSPTS